MTIPELPRRVFLRRSLQAAGSLVALPWLAVPTACSPAATPGRHAALRVLPADAAIRLEAFADTCVPGGGAFEAGALTCDVVARIDALLADEPPDVIGGLASALAAVEFGSPLLARRLTRFSELDLAGRSACLQALCDSRYALPREIYAGLRQLCLFAFYCADASWPALGYDGPWIEKPGAEVRSS